MGKNINRVAAVKAAQEGGQAFRDGEDLTDCPYSAADGLSDEFRAHYWIKGYNVAADAS